MFQVYVGSMIEIYTTLFGWSLYNSFYELLAITGILYFPFLMALYHNWKKPYESQEGKAASLTSQRRMQVAVVSLILVFSLAVLPVITLNMGDISYHKTCSDGGSSVVTEHTPGTSTTRYTDNVGADVGVTRIPLYWWFLLAFSSGVNNAATSNIACFEDIKGLDQQLRNLTIKDQPLREEYSRFANECFLPAKSRYLDALNGKYGEDYKDYVIRQFNTIITDDDQADPFYIGSRFYLQSPGFYEWAPYTPANCATTLSRCSFRAQRSVPHWTYNATRDVNHSEADIAAGTPGAPYCDEWWETTASGTDGQPLALKTKLLNSVEASSTNILDWDDDLSVMENTRQRLENAYETAIFDDEGLEKLVISRYVSREPPRMMDDPFHRSAEALESSLQAAGAAGGITAIAAFAGATTALPAAGLTAAYGAVSIANSLKDFYLTMYILKSAAPFAQAVILMMMYGLMIFYLVASEYDIEAILLMTFLILAVRFFTPLWDIADYLDANLYIAMYQDPLVELSTTLTQGINRLILDMVMTVTYIAVPAILFLIMSMAGLKLGKAVGGMDSLSRPLGKVKGPGIPTKVK
ncbi:MAG: conjugal transfer protein TraG N-terminal domain-containing protein [Candidatus Thiodiazotropha sp. (ex Lucinoma kastoroae)]|nr:conjugal transfer protein TraG N-terminal domain-containing protein [Candidatus Thiodiazotropha sp. (ex Lucinoma kastoroae)]